MANNEPRKDAIMTLSTEALEKAVADFKLSAEVEAMAETEPVTALHRMLSQKCATSTESLLAPWLCCGLQDRALQKYTPIGGGSCGLVFHQTGTLYALKVAKTDFWAQQLWNDYLMLTKINENFYEVSSCGIGIRIPQPKFYVPKMDEDWWDQKQRQFPNAIQPQAVLALERIMPLHRAIRHSLINLYCAEKGRQSARSNPGNQDCLARIYLGKRRADRRQKQFFSLRNFPLHLDQLEQLDIDHSPHATTIAQVLAVMHWRVKCDARDVEFVLGGCPVARNSSIQPLSWKEIMQLPVGTSTYDKVMNFKRRIVDMWMLDFNQVRTIHMDEGGVAQAVDAFMDNDPYYPKPLTEKHRDQELWSVFRDGYLNMSSRLQTLEEAETKGKVDWVGLPQLFIEGVVKAEQRRLERKERAEAATYISS